MRGLQHSARSLSIFIAVLFCLLTFAQTTRPIITAATSGPRAAPVHRQLTRNCVEEVGADGQDVVPEQLALSIPATAPSEPLRSSEPERPAVLSWASHPIHRKLLPPSPQDG